jgi:hypothetical protein
VHFNRFSNGFISDPALGYQSRFTMGLFKILRLVERFNWFPNKLVTTLSTIFSLSCFHLKT